MITVSEKEVLEEICKKSRAALLDIHTIISKVHDDELALDLNRQAARYSGIQEKAESNLLETGVMPAPISILDRTKRWAQVQAMTALNVSTKHVAGMMAEGNTQRLESMNEMVKQNDVTSSMTYELAEEFMNFEEENIRILKSYLS